MPQLSATRRRKWRRLIARLRRELPTAHPVRIVRRPLLNDHATADLVTHAGRKTFVITIDTAATWSEMVDGLRHEYAHALADPTWTEGVGGHVDEHHDVWGVYYAACYRVWETVNDEA